MARIDSLAFDKWENGRAYVNYSVSALDPNKKHYMCWSGCSAGIPYTTSWSGRTYCTSSRLNGGGGDYTIALKSPNCDGATLDAGTVYIPKESILEPKGQIVGDLLHPSECEAGKTFTLNATMRNIGDKGGYFTFKVFDGDVKIGESAKTYLSLSTQSGRNITCTMPSHNLNGEVRLYLQI